MFKHITAAPADPIFGLTAAFNADTNPKKVDLGAGMYRGETGEPYVFKVVRKVDQEIAAACLDKEYQPIDGNAAAKKLTAQLIFGEDHPIVSSGKICSMQTISGSGAVRTCLEFVKRQMPKSKTVYVSDPTWPNHIGIAMGLGLEVVNYPYWDESKLRCNIDKMIEALAQAQPGSVVILHACAHNPVGADPTEAEWRKIANVCKEKNLLPMLDSAYQGFASGDLDKDAFSIRLFAEMGFEFFVCQSFSKNMCLYGERMGMLHVVCEDADRATVVLSQFKPIIRQLISNPPIHPSRLAVGVLSNPVYAAEWRVELKSVADGIISMRTLLREKLEAKKTPGRWDHITQQIGMFSFTGLSPAGSERMVQHHHIYMTKNGRISMAGINYSNIDYIADCIDETVRFCSMKPFVSASST